MAPQNKSKVPVGTLVGGKFRITREIGRGGMAAVYEAENIDIGKRVAVKILAAELITSKIVRERFLREARACAAIRSPYICDIYDSGVYEERPFLVMELLEGESLYDRLTRLRRLDPEQTLMIATHAARGLLRAHEMNIVHRDLKPENIFITTHEDGHMVAKILDFGLAKFYEPTGPDVQTVRLTREGALFGTPAYMSPEQAKGQGEVDHRADLWALGCIVYECLTGQTVWSVDQGVAMILAQIAGAPIPRPSRLRPDLPKTFDQWFLKALDRDPDRRFKTAKEFAETLADALRAPPEIERLPSLHSDAEGVVVDQLISSPIHPAPSPPSPSLAGPTSSERQPAPMDIPTLRPPAEHGAGRAIALLLVLAALGLGGYAMWLYVLHPPSRPASAHTESSAAAASGSAKAAVAAPAPQETEPYALQIAAAQQAMSEGRPKDAVTLLKEAFNSGGSGVARSLLSQAGVALETDDGPCKTTGLGRPRPFALTVDSSRPSIAATSAGAVDIWVDSHQDTTRKQAYTALLDAALRRVSPPLLVTPESHAVRHPLLVAAGDRVAFIYWDDSGTEPGVYARMLGSDGHILGPARRVSAIKKGQFWPSLARAEDGTFWAVWSEELEPGAENLVARRLGPDLEPLGDAVQLTSYHGKIGAGVSASKPDAAIAHGQLYVIFSLQRGTDQQVLLFRDRLNDPELTGAAMAASDDKKKKGGKTKDRVVGTIRPVGSEHGKNTQPRIACITDGCFTAWDDEAIGAFVSFIDKDRGESIWHREFAKKGSRPEIGSSGSQAALAWYEGSRLKFARLSRDGLERASVLARVSGYQPFPAVVPGTQPGQWYVSWRDYEAGHLEAFVVRASCK